MGEIKAKNDLPYDGGRKVDFRTKIPWGSDPHTGFLDPGESGTMESEHIKSGKDYTVEAQIKYAARRDVHISIDDVKEGQTVVVVYDGDQYILKKED